MTSSLEDEIQRIVASMDDKQTSQEQDVPGKTEQEKEPDETIHIHYFPDAIVILKEGEETPQPINAVETTLAPTKKPPVFIAYAICLFYLFLIFSTLSFQVYCIFNPLIATVTIIPKSQTVTLNGTLQLGRLLNPITISQSQTTPTTGKGHQDARSATGTVTFYNGLFTQQFVASGTVYTGNDGVEIVTTQDATIPPGDPSSGYGTATVPAQAGEAGSKGNIQAGDVSITINNGLLVRNNQFHNGQDERTYTTVTQKDIHSISTVLKTTLAQSITGALQGQLTPQEQLSVLPCTPTVTSDYQPGQEATRVKVTVSETYSAIAYNSQELATKVTTFLATQARQKTGAGYSLFGNVHVSVREASVSSTPHPLVFLSFSASGTWIYGLSRAAQQQIKQLIAGKSTQEAVQVLRSLPGIEQASIRLSGFGDATRLPKNTGYMHLTIFVV